MIRFILFTGFLVCSVLYSYPVKSQYYFYNDDYYDTPITWELGFSAGGMNCLTDLGGKKGIGGKFIKDINWNATRLFGSLHVGACFQSMIAANLAFFLGQVTANDNILKNDGSASYGRLLRNLNFRSDIAEASLLFEFHPLVITSNYIPKLSPYLLVGIGFFNFSPKTYFNNIWISLADLHTEGQGFSEYKNRKSYKLTQFNMPMGCGLKYEVSAVMTLRFEIVYRRLWTDYLDDVSKTYIDQTLFNHYLPPNKAALARKLADRRLVSDPAYLTGEGSKRGNEKDNDAYFSFGFRTTLVLGRKKR